MVGAKTIETKVYSWFLFWWCWKPGARPTRISKKPKTNVHQIMDFFIADCWHNGNEHVFCALDPFHVVRNKKTIGSTSRLAPQLSCAIMATRGKQRKPFLALALI